MRVLFVLAVLFFNPAAPAPAEAKVPKGVMNCEPRQAANCEHFWNRQSKKAQDFILSFKGDDRNAALTCYALTGYQDITKQVHECAKSLIGDRRSMTHCEKKGHELMSSKMEKCRNQFRRKNGFPSPY